MSAYKDFKVAFGSLITAGGVKVIEGINLAANGQPAIYVSMHPLGTILEVMGMAFVAVGFYERFALKNLKSAEKTEKEEDAKETA